MTELEQIHHQADELRLEFLLIGGLAVIEHGFARLTTDIDLLVRASGRRAWRQLLEKLGYRLINESSSFEQYERPGAESWPLDLMLVNDTTFDGLAAASVAASVMGTSLRMASLKHLLALKLHVLKQGKPHRFLDDLLDVVELARVNHLDLQSAEFRDLFLRYGNADLHEKVHRLASAK